MVKFKKVFGKFFSEEMKVNNSLKQTVILGICGALLVAFIAFLGLLRHFILDDYQHDVEMTDKKLAQVLTQNINYDIGRAFEMGQIAAEYPELMSFDRNLQLSLLKNLNIREPGYEYIALLDKNDKTFLVTNEKFSDVNKTTYEWYKVFRPNYDAEISPVYFSEKTKNLVVTFAEGIKSGDEIKGVLIGDINLTSLQNLIADFNSDNKSQAYLIDKNGTAIAQPKSDGKVYNYKSMTYATVAINNRGEPEFDKSGHLILRRASFSAPTGLCNAIFATMKGESKNVVYTDERGNTYYCCYQPIELPMVKTTWSLIIVHPTIEIVAGLDKILNRAFLGGIFLIILIGMVLSYFTKKITDPLAAMTEMAERIRTGDLSGELDINSQNELGTLAKNINDMIQGLRNYRAKSQETESRFKAIAYHDALTGLPNRNNFLIHLRQSIEKSVHGRFYGAMIFVDVDKFKSVNDTYGHAVGDGVLIEFGKRLVELVGNKNAVCRYGGDEFLIFLTGHSEENTLALADALVRRMREPFKIAGHEFELSASLGVAFMPKDASTIDELLEKADAALYVSKRNGRNQFTVYIDGMAAEEKNLNNDF